jgi:hypothetical protein
MVNLTFDPTPENDLGMLLEVAQSNFGLSSPEAYARDVENTRADPDWSPCLSHLLRLEAAGLVTFSEERRSDTGAPWVYARITTAGHNWIGKLYALDVEPALWPGSDFDESFGEEVPVHVS